MVWRGSIQAIIKEKPEKQAAQVEKGLDKLVKKWDKMKKGGEVTTYEDLAD